MFVRVFDKEKNVYYKSIVYASVGIGWFLQYIVLNPHTHSFELVDYLDKQYQPAKPLVEIIQADHAEFIVYEGSHMLKYKVKRILTEAMADAYKISVRNLSDTAEWNYIHTQADADSFMKMFAGFHDSTLEKINYFESNSSTKVNAIFDNSGWFGTVELCSEGIQIMKIMPATENFSREISEASLIVENESVFWADAYMEKANDLYEGSIIRALNLKWKKL